MYNDWLSNIDESVKANVNLIKELIDVRTKLNGCIYLICKILCALYINYV